MVAEDATVVLRLLIDRRDELGGARAETTVSRIHHLLFKLIPGGAKKFLTRGQASYLLHRTIGGRDRRPDPPRPARELIDELILRLPPGQQIRTLTDVLARLRRYRSGPDPPGHTHPSHPPPTI